MTREIKFRGKRLDNGEWVKGLLVYAGEEYGIQTAYGCEPVPVDPATVGQFTGEFDYYGKEIYEGDFVLYPECARDENDVCRTVYVRTPHIVVFDEGCFWLLATDRELNDPLPLSSLDGSAHPQVRGNLHDNPELLK